jgi:hypothetical protein
MKFPDVVYVTHYDHSTEESPSLDAQVSLTTAVRSEQPTVVAVYGLVSVKTYVHRVEEVAGQDGNK